MKILFAGGGTMGPVTPLLAVLREMKRRNPACEFAWAGTPDGPEKAVLEQERVAFYPVTVAKFPRFPTIVWLVWPLNYLHARFDAARIVKTVKPDLVVSAGGFTSVPVIKAARRKKIPCAIHQLDAEPGLSNAAVANRCALVTTTFAYDFPPFRGVKTEQAATPCRFAGVTVPTREQAAASFGLDPARPIVFVMGGGTGASTLNSALWNILETLLTDTQVIHVTGRGKSGGASHSFAGYAVSEFFNEQQMLNAYAAADLVVSRAGIGSASELACLSKAAIFVPIPKSHQELNVKKLPCAVVQQGPEFSTRLLKQIRDLLANPEQRVHVGTALHAAIPTDNGSALAERWLALVK